MIHWPISCGGSVTITVESELWESYCGISELCSTMIRTKREGRGKTYHRKRKRWKLGRRAFTDRDKHTRERGGEIASAREREKERWR